MKKTISLVLTFALIFSCMSGVFSLSTSAATYPTYMVRVTNVGESHAWWAQFGLELGSLQAGNTYQLKYMVNTNTFGTGGYTRISNARNGYSNNVTFVSDNYDTNSRVRTVEFTVPAAGTYYLRYVQPHIGTALYFAGFELYNLTTDSAKANNLLNYNATDIKGWSSNWYTATAGMLSFAQHEADVLRITFNANTMGIVEVEPEVPEEPELPQVGEDPSYMVKILGVEGGKASTHAWWAQVGLNLGNLEANKKYQLKYVVNSDCSKVITSARSSSANSAIVELETYNIYTRERTVEFSVNSTGTYYLRYVQPKIGSPLYIAGLQLYNLTNDSDKTNNLLNYNSTNVAGWSSNSYTASSGELSFINDTASVQRIDFNAASLGIVAEENPDYSAENTSVYPEKMIVSTSGAENAFGLALQSLKAGHHYRLSYYSSQIDNSPEVVLVDGQDKWENGLEFTVNNFDSTKQIKTVEFSIAVAGDYFFKMRGTVNLAGFKFYDLTDDPNAESNLISYNLKNGLKDWMTDSYIASSGINSINNNGVMLKWSNFDDSVFNFTLEAPEIVSAENGIVTLVATDGFEYSADGINWQASNVFEGLMNDIKYSFYRRNVETEKKSYAVYLLFPSAPVVSLRGETQIIVNPTEGYEYSTDKTNWYRVNDLTMLEADTEYTVYQRLLLRENVFEVISPGTTVVTDGEDSLDGDDAIKLTYVRKQLLHDGISLAADVNEDNVINILDLVRLKKNIVNPSVKTVACYGDSITKGMNMTANNTYPSQLNAMLGNNYTVLNGGSSGENSFTIAARQGGCELFTENEISFAAGESSVIIGNATSNGFVSSDGKYALSLTSLGDEIPVNPISIGGNLYTMSLENVASSNNKLTYTVRLTRQGDTSGAITIPQGEQVYLNSVSVSQTSDVDIYYMGANGGYSGLENLIEQFKAMIEYHGSRKYIIVMPHWTSEYDSAFTNAFGNHAVNFRKAAIEYGLEYEGITPTATDNNLIALGAVPASLRLTASDAYHLNKNGYHFLAHVIYERGQMLKLW